MAGTNGHVALPSPVAEWSLSFNGSQIVPEGTISAVPFNTIEFSEGVDTSASNTGYVTIVIPGTYLITGSVEFAYGGEGSPAPNTGSIRCMSLLAVNDVPLVTQDSVVSTPGHASGAVSAVVRLDVGDTVSLKGWHNSTPSNPDNDPMEMAGPNAPGASPRSNRMTGARI